MSSTELAPSKTCASGHACLTVGICPQMSASTEPHPILGGNVVLQGLEVETSADSFSSIASGTSINSGTTMTSTGGISGLAMLYHIRVLIPCYKVRINPVVCRAIACDPCPHRNPTSKPEGMAF